MLTIYKTVVEHRPLYYYTKHNIIHGSFPSESQNDHYLMSRVRPEEGIIPECFPRKIYHNIKFDVALMRHS